MTKKNLIIIGIILILAAVVGGFYIVSRQSQNNAEQAQTNAERTQTNAEKTRNNAEKNNDGQKSNAEKAEQENQIAENQEKIDTSDWKEYCNQEYGFCVKYPEKQYIVIVNDLADHQLVFIKDKTIGKENDIYGIHITVGKFALTKKDFMNQVQKETRNAPQEELAVTRILKEEEISIQHLHLQKIVAAFPIGYNPIFYFFQYNNKNFVIKCVEPIEINREELLCDGIVRTLHFFK